MKMTSLCVLADKVFKKGGQRVLIYCINLSP